MVRQILIKDIQSGEAVHNGDFEDIVLLMNNCYLNTTNLLLHVLNNHIIYKFMDEVESDIDHVTFELEAQAPPDGILPRYNIQVFRETKNPVYFKSLEMEFACDCYYLKTANKNNTVVDWGVPHKDTISRSILKALKKLTYKRLEQLLERASGYETKNPVFNNFFNKYA